MSAEDSVALLYRGAVETSMPTPIRESLRRVVGLSAMDFSMWCTYIVHYIDLEEDRSAQALKNLAEMKGQLVKVQLQQAKEEANQNKAERQLAVMPAGNFNSRAQQRPFRGGRGGFRNTTQTRNGSPGPCFYCGEYGHWRRGCAKWVRDNGGESAWPPPFNPAPYYNPAAQQFVPSPPVNPSYQDGQRSAPTGQPPHLAPGGRQMP